MAALCRFVLFIVEKPASQRMTAQVKAHSFVITLWDAHFVLADAVLQLKLRNPLETKTFLPLEEKEKPGVDICSGVFLSTGHEG